MSNPFRKRYPLASGDEVTVRSLTAFDFVGEGSIPMITAPEEEDIQKVLEESSGRKLDPVKDSRAVNRLGLVISKAVVRYHARTTNDEAQVPVGEELLFQDFKVVNKEPSDCEDGEIAVREIPDHIQAEIVTLINRASGVPDLSTFPRGGEANGDPGGHGDTVGDGPLESPPDGPETVQHEQDDIQPGDDVPGETG